MVKCLYLRRIFFLIKRILLLGDKMQFIISILIPNIFGFIGNVLGNFAKGFATVNKPFFAPPKIVFPIVWVILYCLMGISYYIVKKYGDNKRASLFYYIQLVLNTLWSLFFFRFKMYLFSFLWIILIIVFVILMIVEFYKVNKRAGLLQIPYLLWLIFASFLNLSIFLLN